MTPFVPRDGHARWRMIYALLTSMEVNDILTYEDIADALKLSASDDRHVIQMSMRRAAKELETQDKHALETIANVGYRIVEPPEHLILARGQQRKARKALQRGQSKVINVDLNDVEPQIRSAFQVVAQAFALQMDLNRRLSTRQDKQEAAIREIVGESKRSADERTEILERLDRLERDRINRESPPDPPG